MFQSGNGGMRQGGPNNKRPRGRNNNNGGGNGGGGGNRRPNIPNRNQTFDSNGPDVRIRGNAYQVHEKYLTLARDATAAGDRIVAENYYQHAEHYYRMLNLQEGGPDQRRQGGDNQQPGGDYQSQGNERGGYQPPFTGDEPQPEVGITHAQPQPAARQDLSEGENESHQERRETRGESRQGDNGGEDDFD